MEHPLYTVQLPWGGMYSYMVEMWSHNLSVMFDINPNSADGVSRRMRGEGQNKRAKNNNVHMPQLGVESPICHMPGKHTHPSKPCYEVNICAVYCVHDIYPRDYIIENACLLYFVGYSRVRVIQKRLYCTRLIPQRKDKWLAGENVAFHQWTHF